MAATDPEPQPTLSRTAKSLDDQRLATEQANRAAFGTKPTPSVPHGIVKNRSTEKGRKFWDHVEAVAANAPTDPKPEPPRDAFKGLISSDTMVELFDDDTLGVKSLCFDMPGDTKQTANVGAWYSSAVYWKHRALKRDAQIREAALREAAQCAEDQPIVDCEIIANEIRKLALAAPAKEGGEGK